MIAHDNGRSVLFSTGENKSSTRTITNPDLHHIGGKKCYCTCSVKSNKTDYKCIMLIEGNQMYILNSIL